MRMSYFQPATPDIEAKETYYRGPTSSLQCHAHTISLSLPLSLPLSLSHTSTHTHSFSKYKEERHTHTYPVSNQEGEKKRYLGLRECGFAHR